MKNEQRQVEEILRFTPGPSVSKLSVARDKKGQLIELMQRLVDGADSEKRGLNSEENTLFENIESHIKGLNDEIKGLENARDNNLETFIKNSRVKEVIETEWRDASGNAVKVLDKGERLSAFNTENLSLGRAVRGLVTSNWSNAERELRALSTASGSAGVMVPATVSANVIDMARASSALIAAGAKTVPMNAGSVTIARITEDPAIEVKAENEAFSAASIGFDGVTLNAHTIGAVVYLSRELMMDSINGAQAIENAIAGALAAEIDKLGLIGDGDGQPTGILNATGVQSIATIGSLEDYSKFIEAWVKVLTANGTSNGYIVTPLIAGLMEGLTAGTDGQYLLPPPAIAALPRYITSAAPTGTAFFGDFRTAILGVREGLAVEVSTTAGDAFAKHQVAVKVSARIDFGFERPNHLVKMTGITA
jgi:HK97 family phage major capsid protein